MTNRARAPASLPCTLCCIALLFLYAGPFVYAQSGDATSLAEGARLRQQGIERLEAGNDVVALQLLRESVDVNPDDSEAHYWLGRTYHYRAEYAEASQSYREAARLVPTDAKIYLPLGICLRKSGDIGGSIAAYRKAVELEPDNADALNNLSWNLGLIDQHEEAAALARKAVQLNPNSATYHDTLACALFELGDLKGAGRAINNALALDPNNDEIEAHAAKIAEALRAVDAFVFDWKAVAFIISLCTALGLALDRITLRRSKSMLQLHLMKIWSRVEDTPIRRLHRVVAIRLLRAVNAVLSRRLVSPQALIVGFVLTILLITLALYRGLTLSYSLEQTFVQAGLDIPALARAQLVRPVTLVLILLNFIYVYSGIAVTRWTLKSLARGGALRATGALFGGVFAAFMLSTAAAVTMAYGEVSFWGLSETVSRAWRTLLVMLVLPNTIIKGQVTEIPMQYIFVAGLLERAPLATAMMAVLLLPVTCVAFFAMILVIKPVLGAIRVATLYSIESATEGTADSLVIFTKLFAVASVAVVAAKLIMDLTGWLRSLIL